jgi:hypothetical protein
MFDPPAGFDVTFIQLIKLATITGKDGNVLH